VGGEKRVVVGEKRSFGGEEEFLDEDKRGEGEWLPRRS